MPLLNGYPAAVKDADFIVPFPYGSNIELDATGDPAPRLSILSQMAIDAAVEAWQRNPSAQLVLVGETPYHPGLPTTTDLMADRAWQVGRVPDTAVVPLYNLRDGTYLNNTNLQAEAARDYIHGQGEDARTLTLALDYHIKRVRMACEALGLVSSYARVETALSEAGALEPYAKFLPYIRELEPSERMLRVLGRIDPRGRLVNLIASGMGARMVDVVEDEQGNMTVEKTTAAKKLKEVEAVAAKLRAKETTT